MRFLPAILMFFFLAGATVPAFAQRDANTSAARAAYSNPTSNWYSPKKKGKSKKIKSHQAKKSKKAKKNGTDAARQRRRSLQHF